jgi:hypothetical protein
MLAFAAAGLVVVGGAFRGFRAEMDRVLAAAGLGTNDPSTVLVEGDLGGGGDHQTALLTSVHSVLLDISQ